MHSNQSTNEELMIRSVLLVPMVCDEAELLSSWKQFHKEAKEAT